VRSFLRGWGGPLVWGLLILGLTLLPAPAVPRLGILGRYHIDKLVHAFLFGVFFLLLFRAFPKQAGAYVQRRKALLLSMLIAVIYGALTEVMQEVTGGGRSGDPLDFMADVAGVFLATALLHWGAGTDTYLGKHLDRYF
jgi:uncharacterized membrane protein YadS